MNLPVSLIGVPTDIGAGARGASMGPEALRVAGLQAVLESHGLQVIDRGNLGGPSNPWQPPVDGYRHLPEVVAWNTALHDAVHTELARGRLPIVLGGVLIALGIAVVAKGIGKPDEDAPAPWPWRGIALVLGTIVFFAATIRGLGFIPVVLISAFATALSSSRNNMLSALVISVGLTLLCYLIFVVGLGMLVPLVGPWLQFAGA